MATPTAADLYRGLFEGDPHEVYAQLRADSPVRAIVLPTGATGWHPESSTAEAAAGRVRCAIGWAVESDPTRVERPWRHAMERLQNGGASAPCR